MQGSSAGSVPDDDLTRANDLLRDFSSFHQDTIRNMIRTAMVVHAQSTPGLSVHTLDCSKFFILARVAFRRDNGGNPSVAFRLLSVDVLPLDPIDMKLQEELNLDHNTLEAIQQGRRTLSADSLKRYTLLMLHEPDLGITIRYQASLLAPLASAPKIEDPAMDFMAIRAQIESGVVVWGEGKFAKVVRAKGGSVRWKREEITGAEAERLFTEGLRIVEGLQDKL